MWRRCPRRGLVWRSRVRRGLVRVKVGVANIIWPIQDRERCGVQEQESLKKADQLGERGGWLSNKGESPCTRRRGLDDPRTPRDFAGGFELRGFGVFNATILFERRTSVGMAVFIQALKWPVARQGNHRTSRTNRTINSRQYKQAAAHNQAARCNEVYRARFSDLALGTRRAS